MYTKEFKKKVIAEVDLVKFLKAACGITMHKSGENPETAGQIVMMFSALPKELLPLGRDIWMPFR